MAREQEVYILGDVRSPKVTPGSPKPAMLRGHSAVFNDRERTRADILNLVTGVLAQFGWKDVDAHRLKVRDVSGLGGSKTFRVKSKNQSCTKESASFDIALHLRTKEAAADVISEMRMETAASQFAKCGVAGRRIAQGTDWFIESWEGKVVGSFDRLNKRAWWHRALQCSSLSKYESASVAEMGALLAKIHETPTGWFDESRSRLEKRHPTLRKAPRGSYVWYYGFQQACLDDLRETSIQKWVDAGRFFTPLSRASARVVTSHGDFHPANVVRVASGLRVIDFETACVSSAVLDLAWSLKLFLGNVDDKRAFAAAYLTSSGQPAEADDVDDLIFDAECYSMYLYQGALWRDTRKLIQDPDYDLNTFRAYAFLALQAHESAELREQIIENGLTACLVEREVPSC